MWTFAFFRCCYPFLPGTFGKKGTNLFLQTFVAFSSNARAFYFKGSYLLFQRFVPFVSKVCGHCCSKGRNPGLFVPDIVVLKVDKCGISLQMEEYLAISVLAVTRGSFME